MHSSLVQRSPRCLFGRPMSACSRSPTRPPRSIPPQAHPPPGHRPELAPEQGVGWAAPPRADCDGTAEALPGTCRSAPHVRVPQQTGDPCCVCCPAAHTTSSARCGVLRVQALAQPSPPQAPCPCALNAPTWARPPFVTDAKVSSLSEVVVSISPPFRRCCCWTRSPWTWTWWAASTCWPSSRRSAKSGGPPSST